MEKTTWIGYRLDSYRILTYNEMDGSKENAFQLTSYHIGIYTYSKKPKFFMYSAGEPK